MPEFNVATQFTIVGGVDETAKFETLRQHAISNPGSTYFFPPGIEYQYTTPKWLAEVQNVTILAYGASFNNLGAGTFGYSDMDASVLLGSGAPFHDNQGTGEIDPANANSGDLIENANVGDTTITFVTSGDSANYDVGDNILINWYSRQENTFPPNPGFFEYHEVLSVGAGSITITKPLEFSYKAQAPDITSNPLLYDVTNGKARVISLNRTGYTIAGLINWYGGIGVDTGNAPNPNYDGTMQVIGVLHCNIYGAKFEGLYPTTSKLVHIFDSEFKGAASEFDKIVDQVSISECLCNNIGQGTGIKNVTFTGGSITGTFQQRGRRIFMRDVDVHTQAVGSRPAQLAFDQYPKQWIDIDRCKFFPNSDQDAAVQPGNVTVFTPDAVTVQTMTINSNNANISTITQNVDIGSVIALEQGDNPEFFFVRDISFDVSDNLILTGDHNTKSPSLGLRNLWQSNRLIFGADNQILGNAIPFDVIRQGRHVWEPAGKPYYKNFNIRSARSTFFTVNAYITSISVNIVKAYTGTDADVRLVLQNQGLGPLLQYMDLDANLTGNRVITQFTKDGRQRSFRQADNFIEIPDDAWCQELAVSLNGDGGTGSIIDNSVGLLPDITITVNGNTVATEESAD